MDRNLVLKILKIQRYQKTGLTTGLKVMVVAEFPEYAEAILELENLFGIDKTTGAYTESPHTSHSLNPVPFYVFAPGHEVGLSVPSGPHLSGSIAQVGGSLLALFNVDLPDDYLPSMIQI